MSSYSVPDSREAKHEEDVSRDAVHSSMPKQDVVPSLHKPSNMTTVYPDKFIRGEEAARGEDAQFSGVRLPVDNQSAGPMDEDKNEDVRPIEGRGLENSAHIVAKKQTEESKQALSAQNVAQYLIEHGNQGVIRWLHSLLVPKETKMCDASTQTLKETGTQTGEDSTEATLQWRGVDDPMLPSSLVTSWGHDHQRGNYLHPLPAFPAAPDSQPYAQPASNMDALLMALDVVEEEEIDPNTDDPQRERMRRTGSGSLLGPSLSYPQLPSFIDLGLKSNYPFTGGDMGIGGGVRPDLMQGANAEEMPVIMGAINANAERIQARQQSRSRGISSLISTPAAFRVADRSELQRTPHEREGPHGTPNLPQSTKKHVRASKRISRKRAGSMLVEAPSDNMGEGGEGEEEAPGYLEVAMEEDQPILAHVDKRYKQARKGSVPRASSINKLKAGNNGDRQKEEEEEEEEVDDLIGSPAAPDPHSPPVDSPHPPVARIPKDSLSVLFTLPIDKAASEVGFSIPQLKEACQEHGIIRWPYKKLVSLEGLIERVSSASKLQPGDPNATQMEMVLQQLSGKGLLAKLNEIKASILIDADYEVPMEVARLREALTKSSKKK